MKGGHRRIGGRRGAEDEMKDTKQIMIRYDELCSHCHCIVVVCGGYGPHPAEQVECIREREPFALTSHVVDVLKRFGYIHSRTLVAVLLAHGPGGGSAWRVRAPMK